MARRQRFVPFEAFEREERRRTTREEAFLARLFPGVDAALAADVLAATDGDVTAAVNRILSFDASDDDDDDAETEPQQPHLSDACRSVLEVLPSAPHGAVQWAVDECGGDAAAAVALLLGDSCENEDESAEGGASAATFEANKAKARARGWAAFAARTAGRPPQGVSASAARESGGGDAAIEAAAPMTLGARFKLERMRQQFPFVDAVLLEEVFLCSHMREADTHLALSVLFPGKVAPPPPPQQQPQRRPASPTQQQQQQTSPRPGSVADVSGRPHQRSSSPTRRGGAASATAASVEAARAEANALRGARDRLFREAAAAFGRGDGAAASSLAEAGRKQDAMLRSQRSIVVDSVVKRERPRNVVDLHGLTVEETVAALDAVFAGNPPKRIVIICGVGRHSSGPPKLPAAVREYLTRKGLPFSERSGFYIVNPSR